MSTAHLSATTGGKFLTTEEVATRYRTSPSTVRYWRHIGKGPSGFLAGRRVLYRLDSCQQWEQEQEQAETTGGAA